MISICAGLVTVDQDSQIIRLVHYTLQEYFERRGTFWFPDAQSEIADACVTYLSFDTFGAGACHTNEEFEKRIWEYPLYEYASGYWGHHAHTATIDAAENVMKFLRDDVKVASANQTMTVTRGVCAYTNSGSLYELLSGHQSTHEKNTDMLPNPLRDFSKLPYSQGYAENVKGIHIAAGFGLTSAVRALLKEGQNPDIADSQNCSPLHWAVRYGHEDMVELLLSKTGVDCNRKHHDFDATPLSLAVYYRHEGCIRALLANEAVEPNTHEPFGDSLLSHAAHEGNQSLVKLLLSNPRTNPNFRDKHGTTPILEAISANNLDMAKLLLADKRTNAVSSDPLRVAITYHRHSMIDFFLTENEIKPQLEKLKHKTILDLIEILRNASVHGDSPLWQAAKCGNKSLIDSLSAVGIDWNSTDDTGRHMLSVVACHGPKSLLDDLLRTGTMDIDVRDHFGRTALWFAAQAGLDDTVRILMYTYHANIYLADNFGRTPLEIAFTNGHQEVAKLLMEVYRVDCFGLPFESDKSIPSRPETFSSRITCDVCLLQIPDWAIHRHCDRCNDGDFDICSECYALGARCFGVSSHAVIFRTVRDGRVLAT